MPEKIVTPVTLLDQVSDFENLLAAHRECSRGKRNKIGYKTSLFALGERLIAIRNQLRENYYAWGNYRHFTVTDPKARLVMAAPFMDRVVHHAIHRVIEPILDRHLSDSVFACRHGRGNRTAVQAAFHALKSIGPERFAIKLDVKKYFFSIRHKILMEQIHASLPDPSLEPLLLHLLASHPEYAAQDRGIPIGNLTSQLFANFYLASADRVAIDLLGAPYFWTEETLFKQTLNIFYVRYMDDLLIISRSKQHALDAAQAVVEHCDQSLDLEIPFQKRMPIASDPIPFLGFMISHEGYRPLMRNHRRFNKKLNRLRRAGTPDSQLEQVITSFDAWQKLF